MKSSVIVLSLIFLMVATLGVAIVCQNMDEMNGGISMAMHHFSDYHTFTNATFGSFILLLASVVIGLATLFNTLIAQTLPIALSANTSDRWRRAPQLRYISLKKFTEFLSLFEYSPSLA